MKKTARKKLKDFGLDYHKIAEFFGYSSATFANSTRRDQIEEGILKVIEHVQEAKNEEPRQPEI